MFLQSFKIHTDDSVEVEVSRGDGETTKNRGNERIRVLLSQHYKDLLALAKNYVGAGDGDDPGYHIASLIQMEVRKKGTDGVRMCKLIFEAGFGAQASVQRFETQKVYAKITTDFFDFRDGSESKNPGIALEIYRRNELIAEWIKLSDALEEKYEEFTTSNQYSLFKEEEI